MVKLVLVLVLFAAVAIHARRGGRGGGCDTSQCKCERVVRRLYCQKKGMEEGRSRDDAQDRGWRGSRRYWDVDDFDVKRGFKNEPVMGASQKDWENGDEWKVADEWEDEDEDEWEDEDEDEDDGEVEDGRGGRDKRHSGGRRRKGRRCKNKKLEQCKECAVELNTPFSDCSKASQSTPPDELINCVIKKGLKDTEIETSGVISKTLLEQRLTEITSRRRKQLWAKEQLDAFRNSLTTCINTFNQEPQENQKYLALDTCMKTGCMDTLA